MKSSPLQRAISEARRRAAHDERPDLAAPAPAPAPAATAITLPLPVVEKLHKYSARRTTYDGQQYASALEADYARHLALLLAAGKIRAWYRGTTIVLIPGTRKRRVTYVPDFRVENLDGSTHYVDTKGTLTPVFLVKWRLLLYLRPELSLHVINKHGEKISLSTTPG